jgi:hypothetical protein
MMAAQSSQKKRMRRASSRFSQHQRGNYDSGMGLLEDVHLEMEGMQQDIVFLSSHDSSNERKIEILSAILVKEHKMIRNLYDSVVDLNKRFMQNELLILNMQECQPNDLLQNVLNLLNSLGVTEKIDFEALYRKGPPRDDTDARPRPVVVRLHRRDVVDRILQTIRPKPGKKGNRNAPRIVPHLPEPLRQKRAKMGAIAHSYYERDKSCKIKVKDDHVMINGQKITDDVQQSTPKDVLFMDKKTRATIQAIEFTTTEPIADKDSYFQLYHCQVKSTSHCRMAHSAIASIPSVADKTHLISAYTLCTGEFGWQDDNDHGLGSFLYKTMKEREFTDSICFLTREYGGSHIGKKRFEIIIKLVENMIINIEAEPNKHGVRPYTVRPPAMTLPHPSTQEQWITPRHTKKGVRQIGNDQTGWSTHESQNENENDPQSDYVPVQHLSAEQEIERKAEQHIQLLIEQEQLEKATNKPHLRPENAKTQPKPPRPLPHLNRTPPLPCLDVTSDTQAVKVTTPDLQAIKVTYKEKPQLDNTSDMDTQNNDQQQTQDSKDEQQLQGNKDTATVEPKSSS